MLVDGNDTRGIDVGIMTKPGFPIGTIRSNVDTEDARRRRLLPRLPRVPGPDTERHRRVYVLVNHFKSQSGGGGDRRQRQAARGPAHRRRARRRRPARRRARRPQRRARRPKAARPRTSAALFDNNSPLVDVYSLPGFDLGPRPGTFDSCGLRNRLDYILISQQPRQRVPAAARSSAKASGAHARPAPTPGRPTRRSPTATSRRPTTPPCTSTSTSSSSSRRTVRSARIPPKRQSSSVVQALLGLCGGCRCTGGLTHSLV